MKFLDLKNSRSLSRLNQRSNQHGFTLVELLVTLVILSIGIISVGRLFIFANHHARYGRTETIAVSLTNEIREKMLSDNYDDLITIFDDVDTDQPGSITTSCVEWRNHLQAELGSSGRGEITVLDHTEDAEIVDGMVTAMIKVTWQESGKNRELTTRFAISKMGV